MQIIALTDTEFGQATGINGQQGDLRFAELRQGHDDLLINQAITADRVAGQLNGFGTVTSGGLVGHFRRHIGQSDLRQQCFVILLHLPFGQCFRARLDLCFGVLGKLRANDRKPGFFGLFTARRQLLVGVHSESYPMLVVHQQFAAQIFDEFGVLDIFPQARQYRFKVEQGYRITAMGGTGQRRQNQLQTVGIAVAADFTLLQFELMQRRLDLLLRHAIAGDIAKDTEHQLLQRVRTFRLAALDTAHKAHFFL